MSTTSFILIAVLYYVVTIVLLVGVLNLISHYDKKKYSKEITELERDKNLIISASILSELNKVEPLVNNEVMSDTYNRWQEKFKKIKDEEVPKITDSLIEIEELFHNKDYKNLKEKIAQTELEIYYVKTKANFLLDEIKEITLSEEKNRETITKLKISYREIVAKYNNNKDDYNEVEGPLELQFENVDKLFSTFELAMDKNAYTEVGKIVRAIDDTIGNLKIVIEETPSIVLLGKTLIPKKIEDIKKKSQKMINDGYNLDFLNLDYNIEESNKKIVDVFQRLNVLNLEDSIFELKTILDYFDSIYNDFDKEKKAKKVYEDYSRTILVKITKLQKVNNNLYKKIDDIKYSYDLSDEEASVIDVIHHELKDLRVDYDKVIDLYRSKKSYYTKLAKDMEVINVKLTKTEEKLEVALRALGSLKEDELRAREQLDDIKSVLKKAKNKVREYKLPVIPKEYYIELSEASMAIGEIVKELEKTPISIKVLNTRVDTARDLVLKVYTNINEIVKTAKMAELAIIYGNRYRILNRDVDLGLEKAENSFYKGNFKLSLENAISSINIVEPGIHKRLIEEYKSN
ncbi:MAG: hypothetical protein E7158_02775 [Firmicutes bacterium]|nr:hypothetical protein [Bacillota bacterium]